MAQSEVFEYLKNRRLQGQHDYISIRKIYEDLLQMETVDLASRRRLWYAIKQLKKFDYLEVEGIGGWPSYIRLKDKYL